MNFSAAMGSTKETWAVRSRDRRNTFKTRPPRMTLAMSASVVNGDRPRRTMLLSSWLSHTSASSSSQNSSTSSSGPCSAVPRSLLRDGGVGGMLRLLGVWSQNLLWFLLLGAKSVLGTKTGASADHVKAFCGDVSLRCFDVGANGLLMRMSRLPGARPPAIRAFRRALYS